MLHTSRKSKGAKPRQTPEGKQVVGAPAISGYEFMKLLGSGGRSNVFLARQSKSGRFVAIKVMRERWPRISNADARFDHEIQLLKSLDHPNIIKVLDEGKTAQGIRFLVMPYIDGKSVLEFPYNGNLETLLRTFSKMCAAIHAANSRGIVHGDIKPGNLLVDSTGEPFVLDYGVARDWLEELQCRDAPIGEVVTGSIAWAAPEQLSTGPRRFDARTDVYSLGLILYWAVAFNDPYDDDGSLRDILTSIVSRQPARLRDRLAVYDSLFAKRWPSTTEESVEVLDRIVQTALAKDPEKRYQTVEALRGDIHSLLLQAH
ncbi:MAG TPA: serine/threonine-protein kinase [Phycisphaerae bacterium]|jgi:serine/threonine protein kinase|nr:serine/threonine-protein kinase [Phycisphaerae bacterium]